MDETVELDVDDLFNGETGLDESALDSILPAGDHPALQPQTVAPPPAIIERVLNLKYSGCLKRIAWGAKGHITTISEDGSSVTIQCLRLSPGTARWKLTNATRLDRVFEDAISLAWSATGLDLAVIDARGRVFIYTMTAIGLNMLDEIKDNLTVPLDEQSQPVLSFWLNSERPDRTPQSVVLNVTKSNDKWVPAFVNAKSFGPHFHRPIFVVTKGGTASLIYQRHDGQHRRHSMQLPIPPKALLTHGAVVANSDPVARRMESEQQCPKALLTHGAVVAVTEGHLLMALYSFDKRLMLHRIQIQWPGEWKVNSSDPAHPKIIVEVINADIPLFNLSLESEESNMDSSYESEDTFMTHLDIIPASDIENSAQMAPQLWAVFAVSNRSIDVTSPGYLQSSFIRRWNIIPTQRKLHPKFEEISTKVEGQNPSQNHVSVVSLAVTQFPQIITNLELVDNGQMVMITTIDGQTEMWNPISMTPASFDSDPNQVTSMMQAGFSFSPSPASVIVMCSPNASSSIIQRADQSSSLGQALYLGQPAKGLNASNPQESAAASALVLTFVRACRSSSNPDDILSCINSTYQHDHKPDFLARLYSIMFQPTDFINEKAPNSQLERMISNRSAQKALSLQLAFYASATHQPLQSNGFPHPSTWARMWAWITLNLRYISLSLSQLYKEIQAPQQNAQPTLLAPSYLESMCNMIKYTLDLYRFIFETVLEVGDRQSNPDMFDTPVESPYFNLGDEKGDGSQGLIALLLSCNWSRIALLTATRPIFFFVRKADPTNPNVRHIGDAIRRYSSGKGLSLSATESLFNGRWYQRSGLSNEEPYDNNVVAARQIEMMTTGVVNQNCRNTIQELLDVINSEKGSRKRQPAEILRLKLFTDTPEVSWLLLNMDQHIPSPLALKPGSRQLYDVLKKSPIAVASSQTPSSNSRPPNVGVNGANDDENVQMIRRCTRCGSLSEEVGGLRPDWPKNLTSFQYRCICDGYWVVEPLHTDEIRVDQ